MAPLPSFKSSSLPSHTYLLQAFDGNPGTVVRIKADEIVYLSCNAAAPNILCITYATATSSLNTSAAEASRSGYIIPRGFDGDTNSTTSHYAGSAIIPVLVILPVMITVLGVYIYIRKFLGRRRSLQRTNQDDTNSNKVTEEARIRNRPVEQHNDTEVSLSHWIDSASNQNDDEGLKCGNGRAVIVEQDSMKVQRGGLAEEYVGSMLRHSRCKASNALKNGSGLDGSSDDIFDESIHEDGDDDADGRLKYNLKITTQVSQQNHQDLSINVQSQELPLIVVTPPSPSTFHPIISSETPSFTGDCQFLTVPESDEEPDEPDTVNLVADRTDPLANISKSNIATADTALLPDSLDDTLAANLNMVSIIGLKTFLNDVVDKFRRLKAKSSLKTTSADEEYQWTGLNTNPWSDNMDSPADINPWLSESDQVGGVHGQWTDDPADQTLEIETEAEWLAKTRAQQKQQQLEAYVRDHPRGRDSPPQLARAEVLHHRSGAVLKLECINEIDNGSEVINLSKRDIYASEETFGTANRSGSGYEGGSEDSADDGVLGLSAG
ncbi:hypothetical protein F5884DRAFT_852419 [Xylogone sp. PMI_703]|nr:hypothetical protein F5884DRAFT_852419 [Xylogone sp. PMI_703]